MHVCVCMPVCMCFKTLNYSDRDTIYNYILGCVLRHKGECQKSDSPQGELMVFMTGARLSLSPFFPLDLLCPRSSKSKYNASTIKHLLIFFLHFDLKLKSSKQTK